MELYPTCNSLKVLGRKFNICCNGHKYDSTRYQHVTSGVMWFVGYCRIDQQYTTCLMVDYKLNKFFADTLTSLLYRKCFIFNHVLLPLSS